MPAFRSFMKYISVSEFSKKHKIPERTVRNYCATGRIQGAFLTGKTWNIPEDGMIGGKRGKEKTSAFPLLSRLIEEKEMKLKGGIYHRTQVDLTYHSNRIEGSRLSHDQTRYILKTNANLIVTNNLKDFPRQYLAGFGLSAKCADDFLTDIIDLNHDTSVQAFRKMVLNKKNPPMMNFKFLTF